MDSTDASPSGAGSRYIMNCTGPGGYPVSVDVAVLEDRTLELTIQPGATAEMTVEQAASLRAKLADGIADALQGVRWKS